MRRVLSLLLAVAVGLSLVYSGAQDVQAETRDIQVYFEGKRLTFEDTDPILIGGRTMVPFRKIFETLGFEVQWVDGAVRQAIGSKEGLDITLTIDSNKASINGKTVELDVPAQIHKGRTLIPLRFVSENSGFHVYFADQAGTFIVGIGSTEQSANPGATSQPPAPPAQSSADPEPYVAKGRIVNAQGQPLAYAEVFADNTFLYNSNILGVTDKNGEYYLELPELRASYRMGAKYETTYDGKPYTIYMYPEPSHPFVGSEGAVRDFALDIGLGEVELHSWDDFYPEDENAPWLEMGDVELTLKPVGQLLDGSTGSVITGYPIYQDGARLTGIPIGTYELSAVWKPKDYKAVPLLVALRQNEQYGETVTFTFDNPFGDHYIARIEVQFP